MRKLTKQEERRKAKYPTTATFMYYNANPKGKITSDCVIRALSCGLNKDYNEVLDELVAMQKKTGLMLNDKALYEKYLKKLGYEKQLQPRRVDGTKYTGNEFAKFMKGVVIARIGGHHITVIKYGQIMDTWNCGNKCVGNYWHIKGDI